MPLTERAIVTLDQAKDYLGITRATTDHDIILTGDSGSYIGLIEIASRKIEEEINNKVNEQTISALVVDGSGCQFQELPYYPIVQIVSNSVSNLQYRDSPSSSWTNLFSSQSDFNTYLFIDTTFNRHRLEVIDGFLNFPQGKKNIKLSYIAGWNPPPSSLVQVCLEMVKVMLDASNAKAGKDRLGLSSQALSPGSASKSDSFLDMTPRWERMLAPYRKLVL